MKVKVIKKNGNEDHGLVLCQAYGSVEIPVLSHQITHGRTALFPECNHDYIADSVDIKRGQTNFPSGLGLVIYSTEVPVACGVQTCAD